ncbi:hypothetical protein AVEN_220707-1, partial [Araneus ventricosus]
MTQEIEKSGSLAIQSDRGRNKNFRFLNEIFEHALGAIASRNSVRKVPRQLDFNLSTYGKSC